MQAWFQVKKRGKEWQCHTMPILTRCPGRLNVWIIISYIYIGVQIRGRSCAEDFDRYKTQNIRPATTKLDAWSHFCNYKIHSTIWFDSENNSRYALQKPMHLKLKNSWKSEMLTWIFPVRFCSWVYAIQSSDQHTFQKHFVVVIDWIWLDQVLTPCSC